MAQHHPWPTLSTASCQSSVPVGRDSRALYDSTIANLSEKSTGNHALPPWPAAPWANCVEWVFVHGAQEVPDRPLFVCLCGCVICALPKPSIRSKLEQLLPPRFPFSLAFIKNGSVNSAVYAKTNVTGSRQDGIRWLFHPGTRETHSESLKLKEIEKQYLFQSCRFLSKSFGILSSL